MGRERGRKRYFCFWGNLGKKVFSCSRLLTVNRRGTHKKTQDTVKTIALTLYLVLVGRGGFEPPKSKTSDLQSDPFGRSGICPNLTLKPMEPVAGIEPVTC